jgi:hypothetical protein
MKDERELMTMEGHLAQPNGFSPLAGCKVCDARAPISPPFEPEGGTYLRGRPKEIVLLALLLAGTLVQASESAERDASAPVRRDLAREWKDEAGHVIVRVDGEGRMVLLSWDQEGKLVRMAGVAGRVKPGFNEKPTPWAGEAWVHCFLPGPNGALAEVDCNGNRHEFPEGRPVDERTGTALGPRHRHVEEAGSVRPPARSEQPATKCEYDSEGRVTRTVKD